MQKGLFEFHEFFQAAFTVDLILSFFKEQHNRISQEVERDVKKISLAYLKGRFFLDIVTLLPLFEMCRGTFAHGENAKALYLVKVLRLYNGFELLNYKTFMNEVKQVYTARILKFIKRHPEQADDQTKDRTQISNIILISRLLRSFRMIIVILSLSLLSGLFWFYVCDLSSN